ncbi:MAG: hypothetical protein NZ957_03730 [Thaumarchaeota archaeon]|nr:hypothetical protein [Candidatus Calditenuaceae archaeon]
MNVKSLLTLIGVPIGAAALIVLPQNLWSVAALITGIVGGSLLRRRLIALPYAAIGTTPYLIALSVALSEPKALKLAELLSNLVGMPATALILLPVVVYFLVTTSSAVSASSIMRVIAGRRRAHEVYDAR